MMVFGPYVMFSEVYWHHGVRSATAMIQRAFYSLVTAGRLDLDRLFRLTESEMIAELMAAAKGLPEAELPVAELLDGLFGPSRRLYKRVARYSLFEQPEVYRLLARRPYPSLAACAEQFAELAAAEIGQPIAPHEILFDAPPVAREVEFNIEIHFAKERRYRRLGDVSPVVRTLAREQFDDYVKRVRIFGHPRIAKTVAGLTNLGEILGRAVERADRR